jgi:hypothetical protein
MTSFRRKALDSTHLDLLFIEVLNLLRFHLYHIFSNNKRLGG